jgi:uncharacterized protein (DUF1778 family)
MTVAPPSLCSQIPRIPNAMLEDHAEQSLAHHRALLAQHREPSDLIAALKSPERKNDPLGRSLWFI